MKCNYKDLRVIWDHNGTTCSFFTAATTTTTNLNSLVQINFSENLYFAKFESSH
jgi:hypothetical protein